MISIASNATFAGKYGITQTLIKTQRCKNRGDPALRFLKTPLFFGSGDQVVRGKVVIIIVQEEDEEVTILAALVTYTGDYI